MADVFNTLESRVLTHYDSLRAIARGEIPGPRTAILYPVYGCNIDCVGCEYAGDNKPDYRFFPRERIESLLRELSAAGVEGIELCGGGEPTLHPQLPELIRAGRALGIEFGLLTNGTRLKGELLELCARELSYVRIGFNAADAETYAKVCRPKGRNPFDEVVAGARALLDARGPGGPKVSFKMLVSRENRDQVEQAASFAAEIGFDSVQFKALRVSPDELTADQAAAVDEQLADLRARANGGPAIMGNMHKVHMEGRCRLTPLQTVIDAAGDVFLCCYYRHRRESHLIGNIIDRSFAEIWASERHREAIDKIEPTECDVLDCRFVAYHKTVEEMIFNRGGQFEFI